MSMATASIPSRWVSVSVPQKPSRLSCLRSSATYSTRPRARSFTSVRYLGPLRKAFSSTPSLADGFSLPPLQPALGGPLRDAVALLPAQPQLLARRLLAGGL